METVKDRWLPGAVGGEERRAGNRGLGGCETTLDGTVMEGTRLSTLSKSTDPTTSPDANSGA